MRKLLATPRRYIQGSGVMTQLGQAVKPLGDTVLVLWDQTVRKIISGLVQESLQAESIALEEYIFPGEATQEQRRQVAEAAKACGANAIIAFGGGKVLDVAKGSAHDASAAMVSCPTIASTDSPTSACSVWYDDQGNYEGFDMWPFNPDVVLVDTQIIVQAPVHTFVAGMGDALATWLEAEAVQKSRGLNFLGGHATMAALQCAKLSFEIIMEHGLDARRDVANHLVTPAVEKVVEASVLLSGIGFESVGLACAHDVGNFLSNFPECHAKGLMHGHKVGFGILTQLCLDDEMDAARKLEILDMLIALDLPVTLEELGLGEITEDRLKKIGDACSGEGCLSASHPFPVTSASIVSAILSADALGRERKAVG